ncbi:MAG: hypothetical protein ACOCP4_04295 [Candidatus Woesearchaeota archaeon]
MREVNKEENESLDEKHRSTNYDLMNSNLFLFNLVNHGFDIKLIINLYYKTSKNNEKFESIIKNSNAFSQKSDEVIKHIQSEDLSAYALLSDDIPELIVEQLARKFKTLKKLYLNLDYIDRLHPSIRTKIKSFVINKKILFQCDKPYLLLKLNSIISEYYPITIPGLINKLEEDHLNINFNELNRYLEILENSHEIIMKSSGYIPNNPSLKKVLDNDSLQNKDFVLSTITKYLENKKLNNEEIINFRRITEKYPIVQNERRFKRLAAKYDIPPLYASILFENSETWAYIKIKNHFNPSKSFKDYVYDYKIGETDSEKLRLKQLGLVLFDGNLIKNSFPEITKYYARCHDFKRIDYKVLNMISSSFDNQNLWKYLTFKKKDMTLEHLAEFETFEYVRDRYLICPDLFLSEQNEEKLLASLKQIIKTPIGIKKLFNDHYTQWSNYDIASDKELYALINFYIYTKKLISINIFKNPKYVEPRINKLNDYLENRLKKSNSVQLQRFITEAKNEIGLKYKELEKLASAFLNDHKIGNNLYIIENYLDEQKINELKEYIDPYFVHKSILFQDLHHKSTYIYNHLTNERVLEKCGYWLSGNMVIRDKYDSFYNAVRSYLNEINNKSIDESMLEAKIPIKSNWYRKILEELFLIKGKGSSLTYFITEKIMPINQAKKIQESIISILEEGEIFTLDKLMNKTEYRSIKNKNMGDVSDFIEDFLIDGLIKQHPFVYEYSGDSQMSIYRYMKHITKADLVYDILRKKTHIHKIDLQGLLERDYGIKNYSNEFVRSAKEKYDLYEDHVDNIYLNKEIHDHIMEGYLKHGKIK